MTNLSPTKCLERNMLSSPRPSSGLSTSTSSCSLCSDNSSLMHLNNDHRKGQKRRKHHMEKCRKGRSDEAHWSKLLQTCQTPVLSPPPPLTSPPISPIAAFGQSMTRFFKWISPNKRASRKNSLDESDRPTSVSSEDSGLCPESPVTTSFAKLHPSSSQSHHRVAAPLARPSLPPEIIIQSAQTTLQTPAQSTLMTKRLHEKLHRIHKPTPCASSGLTTSSLHAGSQITKSHQKQSISSPALVVEMVALQPGSPTSRHAPLASTISCPLGAASTTKRQSKSESSKSHLADTWPPIGYHFEYDDSDDVFGTQENENQSVSKSWKNVDEFTIPHENIDRDELIGHWRFGNIYRGRWHGQVMIQTYEGEQETVSDAFWEDVKQMSRVRHENIVLFMGVCTAKGNLTLVTSICTGSSLSDKLHITRERVSLAVRMSLAHQVSQALAYLHAKKIVYKHLTSKNVYVEKQKATLSVINFSNMQKVVKSGGDNNRTHLAYLAPELLTYLISSPQSDPSLPHTTQTDIYAFGVLLHELLSGTRPYENIPLEALVLQVSNGRRPSTDRLACPQTLKSLMESCWAHLAHHRSHIHEIIKELQKKDVALHNRFSSSEPDSINKMVSNPIF